MAPTCAGTRRRIQSNALITVGALKVWLDEDNIYVICFKQCRYLILQQGQLNATTMANFQTAPHDSSPKQLVSRRLKLNPTRCAYSALFIVDMPKKTTLHFPTYKSIKM